MESVAVFRERDGQPKFLKKVHYLFGASFVCDKYNEADTLTHLKVQSLKGHI
jgi:hypothetical protein